MNDKRRVIRLLKYLKPYWGQELIALTAMLFLASLALAIPLAVQYMIDDLIPHLAESAGEEVDLMPIVVFGLALLGIYVASMVFSLIRDFFATRIGASIVRDMRSQLFDHLGHVSLRFHARHQTGEIMSRMLSDVQRVQNLLTSTALGFLTQVFLVIAILIYILSLNWVLTLVALIPVPLSIWVSNRYGRKLQGINRKLQEMMAAVTARLQEKLSAVKTVKAFGQEEKETRKLDNVLTSMVPVWVSNGINTSMAVNLIQLVNMIGPVVILAWGTYLIAGGAIQLGALIAFYMLLTYLYHPISDIARFNVELKSAMASVIRIFEYLDLPVAITEDPNPVVVERVRGGIKLENVSFSYEGEGFALREVNLTIEPGEKIAVVGPSGSGKTTLANLIMRFFDPDSGRISLDDIDLRKISLDSLRKQMGLVEQEPVLFMGTIAENIAYSNGSVDIDTVRQAAQVANIDRFVESLPEKYDSVVGERGVTVSGGERQRICLARAIINGPPIVILDEATSALDSQAEQLVQEALDRALEDKTAIIIAHRLSTIRHADRIVLMQNGRIVDEGTHEGLMDSSDLYRELAKGQLAT